MQTENGCLGHFPCLSLSLSAPGHCCCWPCTPQGRLPLLAQAAAAGSWAERHWLAACGLAAPLLLGLLAGPSAPSGLCPASTWPRVAGWAVHLRVVRSPRRVPRACSERRTSPRVPPRAACSCMLPLATDRAAHEKGKNK